MGRRRGASPVDLAAVRVLNEAEGECARCGRAAVLVAVQWSGALRAECLNRRACDAAIRAELRGEW